MKGTAWVNLTNLDCSDTHVYEIRDEAGDLVEKKAFGGAWGKKAIEAEAGACRLWEEAAKARYGLKGFKIVGGR